MKKFINQSEEIPQTSETHLKNNLDGMSLGVGFKSTTFRL